MMVVLGLLAATIYLFVSEIVRVDVAAVLVMVALGLLTMVPGLEGIVSVQDLFNGFASNAVVSIIAVMIIGAGLDKTGVMSRVATVIMKYGGSTETKIIPLISGTVGIISSFMQNVGAAALFLPVVSRISSRTGLPMSRLLMPMGFCAILGGTVTMIGSSPLILLNDLILNSNRALPEDKQMEMFSLFSVTPIGLALVATGIVYFVLAGRFVLPAIKTDTSAEGGSTAQYFKRVYGIDAAIHEVSIALESPIIGKPIGDVEREDRVRIIATNFQGRNRISPPRDVTMDAPAVLAVLGSAERVQAFAEKYGLSVGSSLDTFSELLVRTNAGISEIVIPPDSDTIGKTTRDLWLRKSYGMSVLAIHRGEETITEGIREVPFQAGDTLVCHNSWEALARLSNDRNFVVVTSGYPREELRPHKVRIALAFFLVALSLVLFTDLRLSVALLTGAMGMVVSRVLTMDEAYDAVSWKTVFLLASLIPLGQAVETSGTAEWIAQRTLSILGDVPTWSLQAAIAVLATFFTLVMSNVGATVLLVPLAVNIALAAGADPAVFAITVAIATSNSFLIPTHQVNALIMGPGGYRVADFMRAGGIMTVLFLVVSLFMLNLVF
jgi:di/tricarboxylate transporter